jgi:hypothetical protein
MGRSRSISYGLQPFYPPMLDLILIVGGCACFALAVAYTYGCDRL